MIRHYFTLKQIAESLQFLIGFQVTECFTQEKETLSLVLSSGSREEMLHFSADPKFCSFYLRHNFARAGKNTTDLMPDLLGEYLQSIQVKEKDRVIILDFVAVRAYVLLYGAAESNFILSSKPNDIVIDSLSKRKALEGQKIKLKPTYNKSLLSFPGDAKLRDALAKSDLLLGKDYAEEFLLAQNIDTKALLQDFSEVDISLLLEKVNLFTEQICTSKEYLIYRKDDDSLMMSLIPLQKYGEPEQITDNLHKAIQIRLSYEKKEDTFAKDFKEVENKLESKISKIVRNIGFASDFSKTEEKISNYTLWGEILLSQPNPKLKPGKEISLSDWSGNQIIIPLDEKLDLMQNAHIFYEKSKKSKQELIFRKLRIPKMQEELDSLNQIKKELDSIHDIKELNKFVNRNTKVLGIKKQGNKTLDASEKYKVFDLGDGFTLYVGKNAANNDELTMKFAKANDLWFHVRGISGSHAVIRIEKGQKPGKHIIEKAAAITAYYSKMRNAGLTPVAYTEKKYVRKPKGANPGQVLITKEKVVQVVPALPDGYTE